MNTAHSNTFLSSTVGIELLDPEYLELGITEMIQAYQGNRSQVSYAGSRR